MSGERITCKLAHGGVYLEIPQFNIAQIADSGQCFRISPVSSPVSGYVAVTGRHYTVIEPFGNGYVFHCSFDEFIDVWIPYFDLATDYGVYQEKMVGDPFLMAAVEHGGGIRMLRQDLWEMAVTYVISQRNNIPRIRSAVETLCREFGTPLGEIGGNTVYSFPVAEQLRGKDLSCASLGYREKYIKALCDVRPDFWEQLKKQDDAKAKQALLDLNGVGEKVANCVMLFGLHRMDSYPRDVWINRLIDDVYGGEFDPTRYAGFAGYVQQLQFYHYRQLSKEAGA